MSFILGILFLLFAYLGFEALNHALKEHSNHFGWTEESKGVLIASLCFFGAAIVCAILGL